MSEIDDMLTLALRNLLATLHDHLDLPARVMDAVEEAEGALVAAAAMRKETVPTSKTA